MKKHYLVGVYDYTVILTYISCVIAVIGVALALKNEIGQSLVCLMLSGVCDMFDGAIARTKERTDDEKSFGIQIDSLCDFLCFGILPAIIVYRIAGDTSVSISAVSLYILCALIRLAYFNVYAQNKMKSDEPCDKFIGLPITSAALVFPVIIASKQFFDISGNFMIIAAALLTGILFISPFELKKPCLKGKIAIILTGIFEFIFMVVTIR